VPRHLTALAALLAATLVSVTTLPAGQPRAEAEVPDAGAAPAIELVSQTAVAAAGQPFTITVRLEDVPATGSLTLQVHQRVLSRSELALSMDGQDLRSVMFGPLVIPLSDLPAQADGTRRIVLPIDQPGGLPMPSEGVYPVELTAQGPGRAELTTLVTHLIAPPDPGDEAPDLAVALVAELDAPLALQPDSTSDLDRAGVAALGSIVAGLAAAPEVPATISAQPETIEALSTSTEPGDAELVEALRRAVTGRSVIDEPYVPLDLDALAHADLLGEVDPQMERGRAILTDALGVEPDGRARIAAPTLGTDGLGVLAYTGTTRLVVDDEHLEPLQGGIISYSLAQPVVVAVPEEAAVEDDTPGDVLGLAPDPIVEAHLYQGHTPGLAVSRVLAELALIRLEQPSVARSAIVRLQPGLASALVEQLLRGLDVGRPFEATTLDGAFEHAELLLDAGDNAVERSLRPAPSKEITAGTARMTKSVRADLETFTALVGPDSALPDLPSRHLLVATSASLEDVERREHLVEAAAGMEDVAEKITTAPTFTLTLTARDGTIPLTIRNDSGVPVHVQVQLNSQKLEFPDGDTIDLELVEESTRLDIRVRSRATGAFPVLIDVRTPDGRTSLSTSRYTVRSTAVSGVGLLLSVGAGVFLTVWWARHWRRTRRSRKLIASSNHPVHG
jgi:hypothetical protein